MQIMPTLIEGAWLCGILKIPNNPEYSSLYGRPSIYTVYCTLLQYTVARTGPLQHPMYAMSTPLAYVLTEYHLRDSETIWLLSCILSEVIIAVVFIFGKIPILY